MKRTVLGLSLIVAAFALRYGWDAVERHVDRVQLEAVESAARVEEAHDWMRAQLMKDALWNALGWAWAICGVVVFGLFTTLLLGPGLEALESILGGIK